MEWLDALYLHVGMYSCTRALTYLFTYLHSWIFAFKTGSISETVKDRAKVTINGLYKKSYTGFRLPPKSQFNLSVESNQNVQSKRSLSEQSGVAVVFWTFTENDTVFGVIYQLPLLREEFRIPKLAFHTDLRRRAASRRDRALSSTSSSVFSIQLFHCTCEHCTIASAVGANKCAVHTAHTFCFTAFRASSTQLMRMLHDVNISNTVAMHYRHSLQLTDLGASPELKPADDIRMIRSQCTGQSIYHRHYTLVRLVAEIWKAVVDVSCRRQRVEYKRNVQWLLFYALQSLSNHSVFFLLRVGTLTNKRLTLCTTRWRSLCCYAQRNVQ